jgi:hypothetical protein
MPCNHLIDKGLQLSHLIGQKQPLWCFLDLVNEKPLRDDQRF